VFLASVYVSSASAANSVTPWCGMIRFPEREKGQKWVWKSGKLERNRGMEIKSSAAQPLQTLRR